MRIDRFYDFKTTRYFSRQLIALVIAVFFMSGDVESQNIILTTDSLVTYNASKLRYEFRDSICDGDWQIMEERKKNRLVFFSSNEHLIRTSGSFVDCKKNGEFRFYTGNNHDSNYGLVELETYSKDLLHGTYKEYYPWNKSQLRVLGKYEEDKKHGFWIYWREVVIDGSLEYQIAAIKFYERGVLVFSENYNVE